MTDGSSTPPAGAERRWTPVTLGGDVPAPRGAYTPAIRAGDFVFVSGQVPQDPRTGQIVGEDVQAQTRQVMDNVRLALESAGASLADVVSVTAYLSDIGDWPAFNEVYKTLFAAPYPTRTTVGVGLRGVLVELTVVAYVGGSQSS
jgi:2-iminobutanoate/2-iminopropanoate deaminase